MLYSITPNDSTGPISYNDTPFCSDKPNLPDNDICIRDDSLVSAFSTVSALSSASVYSQESWRRPNSTTFAPAMTVDPRRHAIVFSPSVQWKDFPSLGSGILNSKDCFDRKRLAVPLYTPRTPSSAQLQLSISTANRKNGDSNPEGRNKEVAGDNVVGSIRVFEEPRSVVTIRRRIEGLGNSTTNGIKESFHSTSEQRKEKVQTHNSDELRNYEYVSTTGVPQTKKTSPSNHENGERRKPTIKKNLGNSKGFNKVLSRLSMRPFKKDREEEKKTVSVSLLRTFKVPFSDLKPPGLQISPISLHPDPSLPPLGKSVDTNEAGPEIRLVHATRPLPMHVVERNTQSIGKQAKSKSISQIPSVPSFAPDVSLSTPSPMRRTLSLRQARPPTLIPPTSSLPSYTKMSTLHEAPQRTSVCVLSNPGHKHRRTKSSPAVPQFDLHNPPPWEKEDMPSLPPMNMANARLQVSNSSLVTMPPFTDQTKKVRLRPSRAKRPPGKA